MQHLKKDIELVSPAVIISLGKTATTAMSMLYGFPMMERITPMVGQIIPVTLQSGHRYIIPAFHPAFFLKNHDVKYKTEMLKCFLIAKALVRALNNKIVKQAIELFEGKVISVSLPPVKNRN